MQDDVLRPLHQISGQHSSDSDTKVDSFTPCCVCRKLLLYTNYEKCTVSDLETHSKMKPFCGRTREHICMQIHAFLQGFVFCRVLCALTDRSGTSCSRPSTVDIQNVKSEYKVFDVTQPVSPCSPVSSSSPVTPVTFENPVPHGKLLPLSTDQFFSSNAVLDLEVSKKKSCGAKQRKAKTSLDDEYDVYTGQVSHPRSVLKRKRTKVKIEERGKRKFKDEKKASNALVVRFKKQKRNRTRQGKANKEPDRSKVLGTSTTEGTKSPKSPKKNIMVCRVCGKKCIGQAGLSVHTQIRHAGEKAVECELCGERFSCSRDCEKHRKKVHHKTEGVCHICGKHFKYRHALQAHIKAHTGVKGFVCEQCGKAFLRMTTLCSHRKRAHCCKECQTELVSGQCPVDPSHSQSREKRLPVQDSLNMLQCRECSEVLGNLQSLEAHMKAHRMQRPFHCRVCGNGFHTLSSLTKHSKQHQEKRFKCSLCDKTFTYKCNMQKHLETHVEGRPFQCEFCSKTFKTKGVMDKHMAMHVEDKQYKCHLCGKGLTRLQTLKNHMMKMHPDSGIGGGDGVTDT